MSFAILNIGVACEGAETPAPDHESALQSGFIAEGSAEGPSGIAWYDTSRGVDYGHGQRFECEETNYMARVPSKHKREEF